MWDYTIGGYQVVKKWLSYREKPLLGRSLTPDEVGASVIAFIGLHRFKLDMIAVIIGSAGAGYIWKIFIAV